MHTWHVLQAVTAAAALNDVGSWALIGFQATFYSRVYEVGPEVYAPALAAILPVGGLLGGVGGGLAGDWLTQRGGRAWLTAGESPRACHRTQLERVVWIEGFLGSYHARQLDAEARHHAAQALQMVPFGEVPNMCVHSWGQRL